MYCVNLVQLSEHNERDKKEIICHLQFNSTVQGKRPVSTCPIFDVAVPEPRMPTNMDNMVRVGLLKYTEKK